MKNTGDEIMEEKIKIYDRLVKLYKERILVVELIDEIDPEDQIMVDMSYEDLHNIDEEIKRLEKELRGW